MDKPSILRGNPPTNLWGDLPEVKEIRTPKMVLAEQASLLQQNTKGALTCDLVTHPDGTGIRNTMRIVAPSLGNYSVVLVSVTHQVIAYPCDICSPFLGALIKTCDDETKLLPALQEILQDPKTRTLIANLLQQIKADNSIAA